MIGYEKFSIYFSRFLFVVLIFLFIALYTSGLIASKIKTYSYKDLEFINNEKNIVKNTPSYNRFKDNDSISIKWELRNDLNKINDFHKLDSISFNYSNGKLIINHIFFSQGNCLDFFPIFKINSTSGVKKNSK